jgi:hypothetical protein
MDKQLPRCGLCGAELLPSLTEKDSKHVCSVREKFLRLAGEMSPENLACDGELTRSQIKKKLQGLKSEWKKLERQLGRAVSEDEIY